MPGLTMSHEDESHAGVSGQTFKQLLERPQTAGRSTDTDKAYRLLRSWPREDCFSPFGYAPLCSARKIRFR